MSMQTIFVMSDEASALSELCAGAGAVAARVTAILFGSEAEAAGAAGCGADRLLYCQPSDGAVPEDYAAAVAPFEGLPQGGLKRIACTPKKEGGVDLVAAKRIVDVGRGLAQEADLELCRKLAAALGAEVGCSRPVAENNKWLPKSNYMGITGVQVKPELIVALGVSGQIQHIGGINKSRVIVAVNKDKSAPIFKNADFGVVGDLYKVVPALIEKLS